MNTSDFETLFRNLPWWGGALPANYISQFQFQGPKFMVFNTDETGSRGTHWVAMFVPLSGPLEYFDPLGRKPETYRTYFRSWLEAGNRGYLRNEDRYQEYGTSSCGEFCVYYGVMRSRGLEMRDILLNFNVRNLLYNETVVSDFVRTLF